MPARPLLRLHGFSDARRIEQIVDEWLIDIAYVERVRPAEVLVVSDDATPLETAADREWLRSAVEGTVREHGQPDTVVEWLQPSEPRE